MQHSNDVGSLIAGQLAIHERAMTDPRCPGGPQARPPNRMDPCSLSSWIERVECPSRQPRQLVPASTSLLGDVADIHESELLPSLAQLLFQKHHLAAHNARHDINLHHYYSTTRSQLVSWLLCTVDGPPIEHPTLASEGANFPRLLGIAIVTHGIVPAHRAQHAPLQRVAVCRSRRSTYPVISPGQLVFHNRSPSTSSPL